MAGQPNDVFDLSGKIALVTGGSSGLGVEFALALAGAGADVVVAARRERQMIEVCRQHPNLSHVVCDVADDASVERAVDEVLGRAGRLDVLVNNAGTTVHGPAEEERMFDFRSVMEVNLTGAFNLCRLAGTRMIAAGEGGSIVNVASIFGIVAGSPLKQAAYCASKGAIITLTRELAVQWAPHGVRVNALAPGFFPSDLTDEFLKDDAGRRHVERNTPLGRPGAPAELAGALLLLASDAGSYITGHVLAVDGGWTAR